MTLDDGLPQQICDNCMTNLINANAFRLNCERSQDILEQLRNTWCSTNETTAETKPHLLFPIEHEPASIDGSILSPKSYSDFEFLNIEHVVGPDQLNDVKLVDTQPITISVEYATADTNEQCSDANSDDEDDNEMQQGLDANAQFKCGICGKAYKRQVWFESTCTHTTDF